MAAELNLSVVRGDTLLKTPTLIVTASGLPVDLTNSSFTGSAGGLTMTCAVINPTGGQFSFSLSPSQTSTLKVGKNPYSVVRTDSGIVTTLLMGNIVAI